MGIMGHSEEGGELHRRISLLPVIHLKNELVETKWMCVRQQRNWASEENCKQAKATSDAGKLLSITFWSWKVCTETMSYLNCEEN